MKTYLDCWIGVATALFSQALAGEPELAESLPKPLGAGRVRLCRHPGRRPGRAALRWFSIATILESPLVGEGVDQKAGWGELLREVADAAAGELLAKTGKKCRVEKFEEIAGESKVSRAFQLKSGDRAWTILVRDEVRAPRSRLPTPSAGRRRRAEPPQRLPRRRSRPESGHRTAARCRARGLAALWLPGDAAGRDSRPGAGRRGATGPPCCRPGGPDRRRQDRGPRRGGAGERQLRPAGDRGGRAQEAAGEHTMPLLKPESAAGTLGRRSSGRQASIAALRSRLLPARAAARRRHAACAASADGMSCRPAPIPAAAPAGCILWRSRSAPVFEGGWNCSAACTAARVGCGGAPRAGGPGGVRRRPHRHRIPLGLVDARTGLDHRRPVAPGAGGAEGGRSRPAGPLAGAPARESASSW